MSKSSAQLEREAEQTRAQLAATLDELRARMSPGQLFDEVLDYARDGTVGDFARNLRRQVGSNPVPAALAGLGLAWLMMSAGRATRRGPSAYDTTDEWSAGARDVAARGWDKSASTIQEVGESFGDAAAKGTDAARRAMHDMSDSVGGAASSAADTARRTMHDMRDGLAGAADTARRAYDDMRDTVSGAAESVADTASSAARRLNEKAKAAGAAFGNVAHDAQSRASSVASSGRGWLNRTAEQPLVLAGIGVAIGAALGAALPGTAAENKLMGEKADELKERVGDIAAEQYEKAGEVAGSVYDHVKKEAEQKFGFGSAEQSGGDADLWRPAGESKPAEPMPAVSESVSTAPTGDENRMASNDEAAIRQEELQEPKLR
jgi:hypothetical protein